MSVWTVVIWSSATAAMSLALMAFHLPVSVAQAAMTLVVLNLAGAASILTFAGLGLTEIGLVGVLALIGLGQEESLTMAVSIRAFLIVLNVAVPLGIAASIQAFVRISRSTRPKS